MSLLDVVENIQGHGKAGLSCPLFAKIVGDSYPFAVSYAYALDALDSAPEVKRAFFESYKRAADNLFFPEISVNILPSPADPEAVSLSKLFYDKRGEQLGPLKDFFETTPWKRWVNHEHGLDAYAFFDIRFPVCGTWATEAMFQKPSYLNKADAAKVA